MGSAKPLRHSETGSHPIPALRFSHYPTRTKATTTCQNHTTHPARSSPSTPTVNLHHEGAQNCLTNSGLARCGQRKLLASGAAYGPPTTRVRAASPGWHPGRLLSSRREHRRSRNYQGTIRIRASDHV